MRTAILVTVVVLALATAAAAELPESHHPLDLESSRSGTLWIFDADFEGLGTPDNQGWNTGDLSGTLGQENYWHKDTIRINGFAHLGSLTWWCGTVDECWAYPRGYGNSWIQHLHREFELASWSSPGDVVHFEFDQRFALEHEYDYAYVDVRQQPGNVWETVSWYSNPGFPGAIGEPQDWDSTYGHQILDFTDFAGSDIGIRFRVVSDGTLSCEDEDEDGMYDGAWQVDNITLKVNGFTVWSDDCESPGDNGWVHESTPASGQAGIQFGLLYDPDTHRDRSLGWVAAAVDGPTGRMVDLQHSVLMSPAIDVAGCDTLIVRWDGWLDLPLDSGDHYALSFESADDTTCLWFGWQDPGELDWENGGPSMVDVEREETSHSGKPWLGIRFDLANLYEPLPPAEHMAGIFVDRVRVGVRVASDVPETPDARLHLDRVAPNPCRGNATVAFGLGQSARVAVRVYDLAGHLVQTVEDRVFEAGPCEVTWDGTDDAGLDAASGVYFVSVTAGGSHVRGKVVVLR